MFLVFRYVDRRRFRCLTTSSSLFEKYAFEVPLWSSVRRELIIWDSVSPLISRNLGATWSTTVHAVDASPWGLGVCQAKVSKQEVKEASKYSERWRFMDPCFAKERQHAVTAAALARCQYACWPWPYVSRDVSIKLQPHAYRLFAAVIRLRQ